MNGEGRAEDRQLQLGGVCVKSSIINTVLERVCGITAAYGAHEAPDILSGVLSAGEDYEPEEKEEK